MEEFPKIELSQKTGEGLIEKRNDILKTFIQLKEDFKDEIPDRIVHSSDEDNMYKARKNWFTAVISYLWVTKKYGFISKNHELEKESDSVIDYYTSDKFKKQEGGTRPEDIDKLNKMIDRFIEELKKE